MDVVSPLEALKKVATVLAPGEDMELCGAVPTLSRPDADAVVILGGLTGDDPKALRLFDDGDIIIDHIDITITYIIIYIVIILLTEYIKRYIQLSKRTYSR